MQADLAEAPLAVFQQYASGLAAGYGRLGATAAREGGITRKGRQIEAGCLVLQEGYVPPGSPERLAPACEAYALPSAWEPSFLLQPNDFPVPKSGDWNNSSSRPDEAGF